MILRITGTYTCIEHPTPSCPDELDVGYLLADESGALWQVSAMVDDSVTLTLYHRFEPKAKAD